MLVRPLQFKNTQENRQFFSFSCYNTTLQNVLVLLFDLVCVVCCCYLLFFILTKTKHAYTSFLQVAVVVLFCSNFCFVIAWRAAASIFSQNHMLYFMYSVELENVVDANIVVLQLWTHMIMLLDRSFVKFGWTSCILNRSLLFWVEKSNFLSSFNMHNIQNELKYSHLAVTSTKMNEISEYNGDKTVNNLFDQFSMSKQ